MLHEATSMWVVIMEYGLCDIIALHSIESMVNMIDEKSRTIVGLME